MNKKIIYIYNHGKIQGYLLNLVIPAIHSFVNEIYNVNILSSESSLDILNYFNIETWRLIKKTEVNKNIIKHIVQLIKFIKAAKNRKVIVLTENQAIIASVLNKLFGFKACIVLYKQGALAEEKYFLSSSKLTKSIFYFVEKVSLKLANEAIFVSNKMAEYYQEVFNFKKKFYVINNKVILSPEINISKVEKEYIEIVYAGSTAKWQNLDYILKLFKLLSSDEKLRFKIITRDEIDNTNSIPRLKIVSSKPKLIIEELSKSDIGIIIRDDNILNKVSSPLKIGEYLSAGLAIILTNNIGDYSEMIYEEKLGCLVTGNNKETDIKKIRRFILDFEQNANSFSERALRFSQNKFLNYQEFVNNLFG